MEQKLLIAGVIVFILARIMKKWRGKIEKPFWNKVYNEIYEWIETGWSAIILASFIMYFFLQAFKIPSGSMRMTLIEGDHLFVNKFIYGFHIPFSGGKRFLPIREVKRGDIIVFRCPPEALTQDELDRNIKKDFIKRCIALEGDVVEIKDKRVFINGEMLDEPYINLDSRVTFPEFKIYDSPEKYQEVWEEGQFVNFSSDMIRDNFGPIRVPENCYFALGDNRDHSLDSRFWGPLPDKFLKGRALFLYWPLKRIRLIK
ncbi:MAG: signal peptidase I [Endomicrobiales bacterium]|nr:signal peptidase I [Endomicrobiales bacterium]